jgi:hypothetical protein
MSPFPAPFKKSESPGEKPKSFKTGGLPVSVFISEKPVFFPKKLAGRSVPQGPKLHYSAMIRALEGPWDFPGS